MEQHAQFTGDMNLTEQLCTQIQSQFDKWDTKNDTEAKRFLFESFTETFKKEFHPFHNKEEDSFALTWLKFIHYVVSSNTKTFDKIKNDIRNCRPQQFPGQNIDAMSTKLIEKSKELINSGHFDYSLILNMVDGFLCASKDTKGTFHHKMNELRSKVEKLQQTTVFMTKQQQALEYGKHKVTVKDVCYAAVKEYKDLCEDNMWEPKKLPKDRNTPAIPQMNLAAFNNLIANMSGQSQQTNQQQNDQAAGSTKSANKSTNNKSKRGCFNCGSTDHMRKDCPLPPKTPEERNPQTS